MQLEARIKMRGKIFDGQAPGAVSKSLGRAMNEAVLFLVGKVKEKTPQGVYGSEAGLYKSIQETVMGKGTPYVKGIVGTASEYGEVIEKGRRPGKAMPPPDVLISWIEKKIGVNKKEARRLEFVIRRKIGQKGFPGVHMFEKTLEENMGALERIFEAAGFTIERELNQ
ncbi:MAG: hypothetical protein NTY64_15125 [Deltaproteobacteria bacterium]|nr:hypothetical protein [Deltaproteobacteria bacterium]